MRENLKKEPLEIDELAERNREAALDLLSALNDQHRGSRVYPKMSSSISSSTHPRPNRRQPTSFLGGPFLVNQLHHLPLALVDLIFTFPSTNPSTNHSDLVVKGLEIVILAADIISKEKFPDWMPAMRKVGPTEEEKQEGSSTSDFLPSSILSTRPDSPSP